MIIDTHVHIFPDALAPRVLAKLEQTAGVTACTDLTEATTRRLLDGWGIDLGVVMPIATKPSQQRSINDWAAGLQHGNLISFGTVHPDAPEALEELARIRTLGLHGVKLHPDYQLFEVDDRSVYPLYERAAELGLPVLFHAGYDPVSPDCTRCRPEALSRVVSDLPGLTVIGAHLGGSSMAADALRHLAGRDLYIDISLAPSFATFEQFSRFVDSHDPAKILFASDLPWSRPADEIRWVERLSVTEQTREDIYWRNASRLLALSGAEPGDIG